MANFSKLNVFERLDKYSIPEPNTGCWLWTAAIDRKGFGLIAIKKKMVAAHRVAFEANKNPELPLRKGYFLKHTCGVKACVNPLHLKVAPPEDHKNRARRLLNEAVAIGCLVRPDNCQRCGASGATSDGRAYIHAHHHLGYDHPLEVEWLCPGCHFKEDKRVSGEKNGRAKLTRRDVQEIRDSHGPGTSMVSLARRYGVSASTVENIINGRLWASLEHGSDE